MNARHALVAVAVAGLLLGGGSVALADPGETGSDSRACKKATIEHGEALSALSDAEKAERKFKKAAEDGDGKSGQVPDDVEGISGPERTKLDTLHGTVLRLAEELDEAKAKLKDKCADPEPVEPKPTVPSVGQGVQNTGEKVVTIVRERQVEVVPSTDDGVETGGL